MLFTQLALTQSVEAMHPLVSAHFLAGAQMPPQSTSVSFWFLTLSAHVGVWQTLVVHTLLVQSPPAEHAFPLPQPPHIEPPQSTSVSVPFFTTSLQVGVWQMPPVHTPLVQSPATEQCRPLSHFFAGAQLPPQSVSVSVPFFTMSLQLVATHEVPLQTPLWQSVPSVQPPPVPQRAQVDVPPQSTPDSSPFFTRSVQLGAWHALPVQTPLPQSVPSVHALFVAQRGQVEVPPQSTSLSP
jgi:hypothetical protein